MPRTLRRILVLLLLLVLTLLVTLQSTQSPISHAKIEADPGVFATIAKGMTEGLLPYRDMFDHKGPLLYVIYWLFYAPFGLNGLWLMQCLSVLATLALAYKLLRGFCSRAVSCVALLVGSVALCYQYNNGGLTEDLALPMLMGAMLLCVRAFTEDRLDRRDGLLLGASLAGCVLLRANLVGLHAGYCLAIAVSWLARGRWRELLRYVGCCIGGAVIVCAPFAIGMLALGIWDDFVRCYWTFNLYYTTRTSLGLLEWLLAVVRQNQLWLMGALALGFAVFSLRDVRGRRVAVGTLAAFGASLLLAGMSRRLYAHYLIVMIPFYFLLAGKLLELLSDWLHPPRAWQRIAVLLCLVLIVQLDGVRYAGSTIATVVQSDGRARIEAFAKELDSVAGEDDTLCVYGNDCAPYLYLRVRVGARYPFSSPIAEMSDKLLADYVAHIGESTFFALPPGRSIETIPAPVAVRLDVLYDFVLEHEGYALYRRKEN